MNTSRRGWGRRAIAAGLLGALVACGTTGSAPSAAPLSSSRIAEVIASPDRSAADRHNDAQRMPAQLLAFIGVRPGMAALDVSAGGGYTTELLARAIGPTGVVYGQSQPRDPARAAVQPAQAEGANPPVPPEGMSPPARPEAPNPPAQPEGAGPPPSPAGAEPLRLSPRPPPAPPRSSAMLLAERQQRLAAARVASAAIVPVEQRFDDPVPPAVADARLDVVTLIYNYHDFGFLGVDRGRMNSAIFRALKPGGVYVVADHAGRPGTGISESGSLHRIEEAFLRTEVEAAGFRLAATADFLRNPGDPRDRNTPEPPQAKDGFVLKFVKP